MNGLKKREQASQHKKSFSLRESPQAIDPFKNYEIAKRVSHKVSLTPSNLVSQTWNHDHLTKIVSHTVNTSIAETPAKQAQPGKYPCIKNVSQYGYTNVFPLIVDGNTKQVARMLTQPTEKIVIPDFGKMQEAPIDLPLSPQERLTNMIKVRAEIETYHKNKSQHINKLRLKQILNNRYPHGVHGVESPESTDRVFCNGLQQEINFRQRKRRHYSQLYEKFTRSNIFNPKSDVTHFPKQTFELTPLMKHRKHFLRSQNFTQVPHYTRSRPASRDYNIITNLQI